MYHRPPLASLLSLTCGIALLFSLASCGPDFQASANRLRAQNIAQDHELTDLKEKLTARDATIRGLQQRADDKAPRIQTLPDDRLAQLFTAGRFEIQHSTALTDLGGGKHGLRVAVRTMTDDGMLFPATGTLAIDAVTISTPPTAPARLGTWTFSPTDMKKHWYAGLGLNHFAFDCPISTENPTADIVVNATFIDALTGKSLDASFTIKAAHP